MEKLDMVSVRLVDEPPLLSDKPVNCPDDAIRLLGNLIKQYDREILAVINFKTDKTPINCNIVSQGGINSSPAEPSQIIKTAILSNAEGIIMMHNHPSGRLNPSIEDMYTTERIEEACNIMGLCLFDHIIVAPGIERYYSFREREMLPTDKISPENILNEVSKKNKEIVHENTITGVINKCLKLPDTEDSIKTGYRLLENLVIELDRVLKTDMEALLKNKAREEGLIKTDINSVKKQMMQINKKIR